MQYEDATGRHSAGDGFDDEAGDETHVTGELPLGGADVILEANTLQDMTSSRADSPAIAAQLRAERHHDLGSVGGDETPTAVNQIVVPAQPDRSANAEKIVDAGYELIPQANADSDGSAAGLDADEIELESLDDSTPAAGIEVGGDLAVATPKPELKGVAAPRAQSAPMTHDVSLSEKSSDDSIERADVPAVSVSRDPDVPAVMTAEQASWFAVTFSRIVEHVGQALLGKEDVISLVVGAMLAEGHVLLEDAPGTGKTSLAKALAASVQGTSSRIQFTPDLLPSDVTGVSIYDQRNHTFEFHRGPIFASIVLADEINRASPKTQSALLEVMEESRVTVDGATHETGRPFLVIATQNPVETAGTYRLPEAQLDRFLVKTSIGYPDLDSAERILAGIGVRSSAPQIAPVIATDAVAEMANLAATVHVDSAVLRYAAALAAATRADDSVRLGVSVRGAIAMIRIAKVRAASLGRHYVIPDDIIALAEPVWQHRILLDPEAEFGGMSSATVLGRVLGSVEVPLRRSAGA